MVRLLALDGQAGPIGQARVVSVPSGALSGQK